MCTHACACVCTYMHTVRMCVCVYMRACVYMCVCLVCVYLENRTDQSLETEVLTIAMSAANGDGLHTVVTNERQARELHMVKKEEGMKNAS